MSSLATRLRTSSALGVLPFASVLLAGVLFVACDTLRCARADLCFEWGEARFKNDTDELLFVRLWTTQAGGFGIHRLPAGESRSVEFGLPPTVGGSEGYDDDDDPITVSAYDAQGCLALRTSTSVRELREKLDWTIVIRSDDLRPLLNREDCDLNRIRHALP